MAARVRVTDRRALAEVCGFGICVRANYHLAKATIPRPRDNRQLPIRGNPKNPHPQEAADPGGNE